MENETTVYPPFEEVESTSQEVAELSPAGEARLRKIAAAAELLEADILAERDEINIVVTAEVAAMWNLARNSGFNLRNVMEKANKLSEIDISDAENLDNAAQLLYSFIEAITSEKRAKELRDKVGGDALNFFPIVQDLLLLEELKKA